MTKIWQFASYNLWSLFSPPIGQEYWHCDMKRGFAKARKKEPQVKALLERDNTPQTIGILAQKGVYEFHQDSSMLERTDAVERLAEILQLNQELPEVRARVIAILKKYHENPILLDKRIVKLHRGDEGFPKPILVWYDRYPFNLYAAIDCIYRERGGRLHILDFKTGKSDFDRRQAFVYLQAIYYLYPEQPAIASFYNLETGKASDPIEATEVQLQAIRAELKQIAQQHQEDLKAYWRSPASFAKIFPPNPGVACRYCPFKSICQFSISEVPA